MRYTTKRNGKNVIPLLMAVCGIDLPYWRIDRADDLHSYLSGDAADEFAAYEDAEEHGLLVRLPCKVGDTAFYIDGGKTYKAKVGAFRFNRSGIRVYCERNYMGFVAFEGIYGKTVFLTREEAEAALKGETEDV